jgi:hypothetical protein
MSTVSFVCWLCVLGLGASSAWSLAANSFHPASALRLFLEDSAYHAIEVKLVALDKVHRASAFVQIPLSHAPRLTIFGLTRMFAAGHLSIWS